MSAETTTLQLLRPSDARIKALNKMLASMGSAGQGNVYALAGSSAAVMIGALPHRGIPVLVVADTLDDAGYLYHDLCRIIGGDAVAILPSAYKRDIRYGQPDPPSQILRTDALSRWHTDKALRCVVTYPEALAEKVAPRQSISDHTLTFDLTKPVSLTDTIKWLRNNGFVEVDYVYEPGQFASRGSILDIFGYSHELPYRLDFFGDEIDTMRTFDVETQLSRERIERLSITADTTGSSDGTTLLEYISPDTLIAVSDEAYALQRIDTVAHSSMAQSSLLTAEAEQQSGVTDANATDSLIDAEKFAKMWHTFARLHFTAASTPKVQTGISLDFRCSPQALYHKNFDLISESFRQFIARGYQIDILSDSEKQIERLRTIFADRSDDIPFSAVHGTLHQGYIDHQQKRCVFTDHQIFDRFHKYTLRSERARSGKVALSLKELSSIEPGDFIVHTDHGVGRFAGLYRTPVNGHMQEMIKLTYANNDTIFVSIHSLHKLSKYRGKEGVAPKISKLGSGAWDRMKERTKTRLKDIARDLIKLYAARRREQGHAFAPDSYMQHELEASFVYEDTPDQLTATRAVKADMESARPMDRLICGDVGFGKTEVAIRAAFKAASDSKQTAVLVPTTVLAYQHYHTFSKRLKDFPVRVEYLSRARTAKQTKQILADLADGKIDILIGTHKIIGKQVNWKDLGLLVVDEEQKFGVAVKDRLKQLKTNVDTLTMSATPIPRTLQFSLMGARDLSAITTPPPNRYPIVTQVSVLTDDLLGEAIGFELSRNGQVFVVNNRIEGLEQLETQIHRLIPEARVAVGHGQMPPEQLERTIIDFANHDYDILLSTTIIESGVDMPNVNTILINNAHCFGLSELHQLRGRVGRSSRKAFCYLTVPPGNPLSPTARRRLQAIENFSDLGSGIHIAMQDLDIRGAGNLLGAEQSGFIADLGYETYQRILKEAVTELRAEEFDSLGGADTQASETDSDNDASQWVADCVIESDLELLLPPDYVPSDSERIDLYRQLDSVESESSLLEFRMHLQDRFGKMPPVAAELLRIPRLRMLARRLGIEKVALKQSKMYLYFVDDSNRAYYQSPMFGRLLNYLQQNPRRCQIREKASRRSFAIAQVDTVETAVAILDQILTLPTL